MTKETVISKGIQAKHYSNARPETRKPKRNDYLLISAEHLFKLNHDKKINNEKNETPLIVRLLNGE